MRNFFHLYLLSLILLFGSCKALKNATAKDNSATDAAKTSGNTSNNVFLDDISVKPGSRKTIVTKSFDSKTYGPAVAPEKDAEAVDKSSDVQVKYASILELPSGQLVNTKLLDDIDYWWGTRYCLGGTTENCTDCSAFTQNLMRDVYDVNLPRTAVEQYHASDHIKRNDLQEGDLVFFQTSRRGISHVGVYVANNKFVHASVSSGVTISDLDDPYWKKRYRAAGRVIR